MPFFHFTCLLFVAAQGLVAAVNLAGDAGCVKFMVRETFESLDIERGEHLLLLPSKVANVDLGLLTSDGIEVQDSTGPLQLLDSNITANTIKSRYWKPQRKTVGPIHVLYTALPRNVSAETRNGPALDLRLDGGGFVGSGIQGQEVCATLHWDLSDAPEDVSAAWTYGDNETTELRGTSAKVQSTFFAVSPVKSLKSRQGLSSAFKNFNMYWFGNPPFDAFVLGDRIKALFDGMRVFFHDVEESYRVFVRHNAHVGSLTGTAQDRSFLFAYDDSEYTYPTIQEHESVLAHEMVHSWVLLYNGGVRDNWYQEGFAEYFQVLLRYRIGHLTPEEYVHEVNKKISHYYTSSLVGKDLDYVSSITWNISDAQRTPYIRGFTFELRLNGLIIDSSLGKQSLDNLVVELAVRRQAGALIGISDFLSLLSDSLKDKEKATSLYENMRAGELVVPSQNSLAALPFLVRLVRKDLEGFELGFDESAIMEGSRPITGLIKGSRAEISGLRNGDRVKTRYGSAYTAVRENADLMLTLDVERDSMEMFSVTYKSRSWEKVEAYQYIIESRTDEL
ncbi:hypothetical protein F5884DRAFT_844577 [Xylogone sp. PMI_703]|nr:hypothetical protein F5884DRAFT_844577 [Xylogone sp. PMI_703]